MLSSPRRTLLTRRTLSALARFARPTLAPLLGAPLMLACGGSPAAMPASSLVPSATIPPLPAAILALPITIQTSAVVAAIEKTLPRADSLDRARCLALGGVVCHQYVYRRDTLQLRVVGDRVDMLARLHYRGRVALPTGGSVGSCGFAPEPMPRAELRFTTSLYWRTDWRLATRGTQLSTLLPDPCEVTLLRLDATPLMKRIADWQLARAATQVDSAFPALADLRAAADSLWRQLQTPMPVDSAGTSWLLMSPESVGLAAVDGRGTSIRTGVTLVARPRIVSGPRPRVALRPLPRLVLAPPASGLRVPVEIELPFAEIGKRAAEVLAAETAGQPLRVTRVDVGGAGDSATVRLDLVGRMNGALTLVGRPRYDTTSRTLVLDDLHYTVASRDALTRVKATLGAPLIRRAIDQATGGGRPRARTAARLGASAADAADEPRPRARRRRRRGRADAARDRPVHDADGVRRARAARGRRGALGAAAARASAQVGRVGRRHLPGARSVPAPGPAGRPDPAPTDARSPAHRLRPRPAAGSAPRRPVVGARGGARVLPRALVLAGLALPGARASAQLVPMPRTLAPVGASRAVLPGEECATVAPIPRIGTRAIVAPTARRRAPRVAARAAGRVAPTPTRKSAPRLAPKIAPKVAPKVASRRPARMAATRARANAVRPRLRPKVAAVAGGSCVAAWRPTVAAVPSVVELPTPRVPAMHQRLLTVGLLADADSDAVAVPWLRLGARGVGAATGAAGVIAGRRRDGRRGGRRRRTPRPAARRRDSRPVRR